MAVKILILNTGGTLSSVMKDNGLAPGLSTLDLKKQIHMVSGQDMELEMKDLMSVDSANIFPEDWAAMAASIADYRKEYDGIVIIHGTDTMAYTASMLSYMLQNIEIPVILTGSQLSIENPVADALENLRCAIHMAATGCQGVFLAFNRKVILGCRASKTRSLDFDAFDSINYPLIAHISSLGLSVNQSALPHRTGPFQLRAAYSDKAAMLKFYPGIHRELLHFLQEKGYRGVYLEGYGMGGIPFLKHDFISTIGEMTKAGMTVLVGTQCRYEGSNLTVYETGRRTLDMGALQAHDMTSEAAITKLMWVLGQTDDPGMIRDYFERSLTGEVTIRNCA